MEKSKIQGAISLIVSQTNYTKEVAEEKLIEWEYNYINVIKEYLNPKFKNSVKKQPTNQSINQRTMKEIRNFMDDVNKKYKQRKEESKILENKQNMYKKQLYQQFLNEKKKHPNCMFDPPKINTCRKDCKNPMCPGELSEDNRLFTKTEPVNKI